MSDDYGRVWADYIFEAFDMQRVKNIYETKTDTGKVLEIYMPGYSKNDVSVKFINDFLIIKPKSKEDSSFCYKYYVDRLYQIPEDIKLKDGIMTISLFRKDLSDDYGQEIEIKD